MVHSLGHGQCADEHHDHGHEHDHDHDMPGGGPQDNLFVHIDRENVVALNSTSQGSTVIKPWHERTDETKFVESDADDQLILRVPFTGSVKLRSLLLKTGPADLTPTKVALFPNIESFDFSDLADREPTHQHPVAQSRDVGEYALKPAKFSSVSTITLFFPAAQGGDVTRVYYVGFLGQFTQHRVAPIITVYEAQANPADHQKIKGTDGLDAQTSPFR
ncbi:galactose-binding domain-like protein [Vararia minispora EC-137]|uniref:Galactose-binding domain-like protein n=1 Tax=Vararia minispora EC-137 TaxID=1314806 RepID=A0ACB8QAZ6_9AGAM|nr:galactose-binding domain-like protein [Vararia minispora EC-137]